MNLARHFGLTSSHWSLRAFSHLWTKGPKVFRNVENLRPISLCADLAHVQDALWIARNRTVFRELCWKFSGRRGCWHFVLSARLDFTCWIKIVSSTSMLLVLNGPWSCVWQRFCRAWNLPRRGRYYRDWLASFGRYHGSRFPMCCHALSPLESLSPWVWHGARTEVHCTCLVGCSGGYLKRFMFHYHTVPKHGFLKRLHCSPPSQGVEIPSNHYTGWNRYYVKISAVRTLPVVSYRMLLLPLQACAIRQIELPQLNFLGYSVWLLVSMQVVPPLYH